MLRDASSSLTLFNELWSNTVYFCNNIHKTVHALVYTQKSTDTFENAFFKLFFSFFFNLLLYKKCTGVNQHLKFIKRVN